MPLAGLILFSCINVLEFVVQEDTLDRHYVPVLGISFMQTIF